MKKTLFLLIIFSLLTFSLTTKAETLFTKDLYFGIQGDSEVIKLQEFLTDEGLYSGPITGNFFSLTLKAVKTFQQRENITPVAGYFGPITRTKANAILSAQIGTSEEQAVLETGATTTPPIAPKTTTDVVNSLQSQLNALLQQVALLQQQLQTQRQTQQSVQGLQNQVGQQTQVIQQQQQTLQQIQQNTQQIQTNTTPPTPLPTTIFTPIPTTPTSTPTSTPLPIPTPTSTYTPTSITTQIPTPPDTTSPTISNIQVSNITTNSAVVSFETDESSITQFLYSPLGAYIVISDSTFSKSHNISLTGLLPSTIYYYKISVSDKDNNTNVSNENSFSTRLENIINVPADYSTIQAAINAAKSGDNIKIASGVYYENITLKDGVNIFGENNYTTIIDGGNNGYTIKAANNSIIQYLTIQNSGKGWDKQYETHFSGIFSLYKSPKILLNNIQNNGDGIYIYGSDGLVNKTLVMYNNIHDNNGDYATGVMIRNGYNTTIKYNLIKNNRIGIQAHEGSAEIEHNTIIGGTFNLFVSGEAKPYAKNNIFYDWKDGYGIYLSSGSPIIEYNDIYNGRSAPSNFSICDISCHNKFLDPLFVSDSDYHLSPDSPCINLGAY